MGGGGKGSEGAGMESMAPYINNLMGKGDKIWKEATPLRESMLGQYANFLGLPVPQKDRVTTTSGWNMNYVDPAGGVGTPRWETTTTRTPVAPVIGSSSGSIPDAYMPFFTNQKLNLEKNFNQGADIVKAMTPGGAQNRALTDLITNRSQGLSNVYSNVSQDVMNKLWSFTTGTGISSPLQAGSTAMTGAAQAGMLENQLYGNQQAQKQGKGQGMGGMVGQMFTGGTKPWILA